MRRGPMSSLKVLKRRNKRSELQVIDRTAPPDGGVLDQNIKNLSGLCEVLVLRLAVVLGPFGLRFMSSVLQDVWGS